MKKILFGALWSVVFYILLWILFAVIVYVYTGGDYANFEEGYAEGTKLGEFFVGMGGRIFILIISLVLAGILTYKEMLPGTKTKVKPTSNNTNEKTL